MSWMHEKPMTLSLISLVCSIVGIVLIIKGQYELGIQFKIANGKTQALYGLRTLSELKLIAFGAFASILSLISYARKENRKVFALSMLVALIAIVLPLTSLWKLWA